MQYAKSKGKRGRAIGEMIMGIKREMMEKGTMIEGGKEGLVIGKIRCGEER